MNAIIWGTAMSVGDWAGWHTIDDWLYRWQTLITGGTALLAAFLALRPVKSQLALMRAQNSVMLRSTINQMIVKIDADLAALDAIVDHKLSTISSDLHHFEERGRPSGFEQWVDDKMGDVSSMARELGQLFGSSYDVGTIEVYKQGLYSAIKELNECLRTIFKPNWEVIFPEQCDWTEEEAAQHRADAKKAEGQLQAVFDATQPAVRSLVVAYEAVRIGYVKRLREIDDALLKHHIV